MIRTNNTRTEHQCVCPGGPLAAFHASSLSLISPWRWSDANRMFGRRKANAQTRVTKEQSVFAWRKTRHFLLCIKIIEILINMSGYVLWKSSRYDLNILNMLALSSDLCPVFSTLLLKIRLHIEMLCFWLLNSHFTVHSPKYNESKLDQGQNQDKITTKTWCIRSNLPAVCLKYTILYPFKYLQRPWGPRLSCEIWDSQTCIFSKGPF